MHQALEKTKNQVQFLEKESEDKYKALQLENDKLSKDVEKLQTVIEKLKNQKQK